MNDVGEVSSSPNYVSYGLLVCLIGEISSYLLEFYGHVVVDGNLIPK